MTRRPGPVPGSFRRQIVVITATVTALVVVVLTVLLQLVLSDTERRNIDTVLGDRVQGVVRSLGTSDGRLEVPDARLEAGVAVYDDRGTLVAGNAPASLGREYRALSTATTTRATTVGEESRVLARPFSTDGVRGVVVVTERLAPYEETERYAFWVSVGAGVLMVLVAAALTAYVGRRALAPVATMAATAEDWSQHDLSRRFALGPPTNEITALGHTLDGLLDRVAQAILAEQRLTAELAHELRTPLTAVQASAGLLSLQDDLPPDVRDEIEEILAGTRRMADTITALLTLARTVSPGGGSGTPLLAAARAAAEHVGGDVEVTGDPALRAGVPEDLVVRSLAPVVDNAARFGDRVALHVRAGEQGWLAVDVEDDGPGVVGVDPAAVFDPGITGDPGRGHGLGLALARRLVRGAGGEVTLTSASAPTRFTLTFPAVRPGNPGQAADVAPDDPVERTPSAP